MTRQPKKIFIIYSRADEPYRKELSTHLRSIERAGEVEVWSDRELIPGEEWEPAIRLQIAKADIVLLLISADYFQSSYIHEVEIHEVLGRHRDGKVKLLPILVRPCFWELDPILSQIQILPSNAQAVQQWPIREAAWVDVVIGIRNAIKGQNTTNTKSANFDHKDNSQERLKEDEKRRRQQEFTQKQSVFEGKQDEISEQEAEKERHRQRTIKREQTIKSEEKIRKEAWETILDAPSVKQLQAYKKRYPKDDLGARIHGNPELKEIYQALKKKEFRFGVDRVFIILAACSIFILYLNVLMGDLALERGKMDIAFAPLFMAIILGFFSLMSRIAQWVKDNI